MAEQEIKQELAALRAELEGLSRRLESSNGSDDVRRGRAPDSGSSEKWTERLVHDAAEHLEPEALAQHLAKFLQSLGHDVRASKPKALVAAFVAGFAAGRLVGR